MQWEKYLELDRFFHKINSKIHFLLINPTCTDREKKRFMNAEHYNPVLSYPKPVDYSDVKKQIAEIKIGDDPLGIIFEQKRDRMLKMISLIESRGTEDFTQHSIALYGKPSVSLVEKALELLKIIPQNQELNVSSEQAMNFLNRTLSHLKFNWDVKLKNMPATAAVIPSKKTLYLKRNLRFSEKFLRRLVVHEIGTHVFREENAIKQPLRLFSEFPDYLMTEEGLAVVNEEMNGSLNDSLLRNYAGRVIAVDFALRKSFLETFMELSRYFDAESAWKITLRAKRGIKNTSLPGGCTKDYLYLEGYYQVKNYLANGGSLHDLYIGKIGLEHIPILKDVEGIKPHILPNFDALNLIPVIEKKTFLNPKP